MIHNPTETRCPACDLQLIHLADGSSICPDCSHTPQWWRDYWALFPQHPGDLHIYDIDETTKLPD